MKTITLPNNATLELPEDWSEVPAQHRLQVWNMFVGYLNGQMNLFAWQYRTLLLLTDYRPSRRTRRVLKGKSDNTADTKEIMFNLIHLAEQLMFPFEHTNNPQKQLKLKNAMQTAPFACSIVFDRRGVEIQTNLTAGQYARIIELLMIVNDKDEDPPTVMWAMQEISRLLGAERFKKAADKERRQALKHMAASVADRIDSPVEDFAFTMWAAGIVEYFRQHEVYGILYTTESTTTWSTDDPVRKILSIFYIFYIFYISPHSLHPPPNHTQPQYQSSLIY